MTKSILMRFVVIIASVMAVNEGSCKSMSSHQTEKRALDDVTDIWRAKKPNKTVEIDIKPCKSDPQKLCGTLYNLNFNSTVPKPYLDRHNPDTTLQNRQLVGLEILHDMTLISPNNWDDGTLYNPENGQTYSCAFKLILDDQGKHILEARIYKGIYLFGETHYWTRP